MIDQILRKALFHKKKGEVDVAKKLYEQVLEQFPKNIRAKDGLNCLYNDRPSNEILNSYINLYKKGELLLVIEEGKKLLKKFPKEFVIWNILGSSYQTLNRNDEAESAFEEAVSLKSDNYEAYNRLGVLLKNKGDYQKALVAYNKVILIKPEYANAYYNIGNIHQILGDSKKSLEFYEKAISLDPKHWLAYNNKANVLKSQHLIEEALYNYNQANSIKPDSVETLINIGNIFQELNKFDEAIDIYNKILIKNPKSFDTFNNIGIVFQKKENYEDAIKSFRKAILYNPNNFDYYNNLGNVLKEQGKNEEAIQSYERALSLNKNCEIARTQKLSLQSLICDWAKIAEDNNYISTLGIYKEYVPPFSLLSLEDNPENHRKRSELFAKLNFSVKEIPFPSVKKEKSKRIRIGYFSSDFKEHPVAYLMAKVFEKHDRNKFEVYGYSIYGFHEDSFSERLKKSFDIFDNVSEMSDKEIAFLARQDNLDIAIDLNGYTENARPKIFAYRAAPIQINYLGYPGTMGADFMDYIIADRNLIPTDKQHFYTEKPIYLPHHYQAQDDSLRIADQTPSKLELGLPDEGFVFCAINSSYKITPREFDIWMRLLKKVDKSVLWLLDFKKGTKENLMNEAVARGVNPSRLVFAKYTSHEKYLAQFRQADLFLDTFNYNAGATASNALWVGLPVLTKSGESYTSRMAGSLLSSIGLNNLITDTEEEYEKVALDLATNPDRLSNLRNELAKNILSKPLFKTQLFIDHLEKGYIQAYQNYLKGQKPQTIFVSY